MISTDMLNPEVTGGVGMEALAAAILTRLALDERTQFLADLDRWNQRHDAAMADLASSPEWREIEQWRAYILDGTIRR